MKVLLLNQSFYPDQTATAQQTLDLALFLKAQGCEVTAVSGKRSYEDPNREHAPSEEYKGIRILRVGSWGFGKRSFFHRVLEGISFELMLVLRLLRLPSQDVVIGFTSPPLVGFLGALFCLLRGGRSVQWLMDVNPDAAIAVGYIGRHSLAARFLNAVFAFSLKHSRHIIVLDRWMRERIIAHGAEADRISIIPPWAPPEVQPAEKSAGKKFRAKHGLEDKFIILYSGNHSIVHPLDTLLDAAVLMKKREDVVFLFIGGGLRVEDVTAKVKKHRLKNVIQLPSQPREDLSESLGCADVHVVVMGEAVTGLVHTSKIYGVLATGKPYVFIGPRRSHVADLLSDFPFGFHVNHGAPKDFVGAIGAAQKLTPSELATFREQNTRLASHYGLDNSLAVFSTEILGAEPAKRKRRATAGQRA